MGQAWKRFVPVLALALLPALALAGPGKSGVKSAEPDRLGMTPAVACLSVTGYEDYVERPEATLTADEKLVIYYRPLHFATERVDDEYQAHLVQDARIHRRGNKRALQTKDRIIDFVARDRRPPANLYLTNTISVADLKPGDYDFEIILHDAIGKGRPATQVLPFTIVPEPEDEPDPKEPGRRKPNDEP